MNEAMKEKDKKKKGDWCNNQWINGKKEVKKKIEYTKIKCTMIVIIKSELLVAKKKTTLIRKQSRN